MSFVIAIDGPAGSGTSTLTKNLCRALRRRTGIGWQRLNTGTIYRSVAWLCDQKGISLDDEAAVTALAASAEFVFTDGVVTSIAGLTVTEDQLSMLDIEAKTVAKHDSLRTIVREQQHWFADQNPFMIIEGRDIAIKVFPNATIKIWVDADPAVRARRLSLKQGQKVDVSEVMLRDEEDRTRKASPMRAADDAVLFDSTELDEVALLEQALTHCLDVLDL